MRSRANDGHQILRVAAGAALVTGSVQVLVNAYLHLARRDFIWLSREYVWMVPLGYLAMFTGLGLFLVVIGLAWPRVVGPRVTGFIFGTLGVLSLVLLIPGLHHLAALALAVGAGTRVAAWLARRPESRSRALGRAALVLTIVLVGAGTARWAQRTRAERAPLTPLATAAAPNVLIIILDTVRAASMSFLGYPRETTPNLARLGAEGAVFESAFATAPWTLPSHAGMFTGRYPSQLSTDWMEPLDGAAPTLAEILSRSGYQTAGFVANHYYTSYESGLSRGFRHYDDYRITPRQVLLSTTLTHTRLFWALLHNDGLVPRLKALLGMDLGLESMWTSHRKEAPEVTDEFLSWQERVSGEGRPFMAFLNYYDAHLPYDPPAPWRQKFSAHPTELDLYDGAIAYIDDALGRLFAELAARGVLDNTLVIVSSDHGEGFGEHGLHGHGNSLYFTELHVPLVIRYPARMAPGTRITSPVTLRDMGATALDATGLGPAAHEGGFPGESWLGRSDGTRGGSPVISEVSAGINTEPSHPVSRGPMQSLVTDSTHYIRNGDGVEELYRWRTDLAEMQDIAPSSPDTLKGFRKFLAAILR